MTVTQRATLDADMMRDKKKLRMMDIFIIVISSSLQIKYINIIDVNVYS